MRSDFWDDKRPVGIPNVLPSHDYKSLVDVISRSCSKYSKCAAFSNLGVTITYADLDRYSAAFASYLQRNAGLQKGDRIAIQMPNSLQYPIAVLGAIRAGLVVVNTNPLYTPREMAHQFKDATVKALVYFHTFGDKVQEVLEECEIPCLIEARVGDMFKPAKSLLANVVVKYRKKLIPKYRLPGAVSFRTVLKMHEGAAPYPVPLQLADVAMLQYTGGTTGVAKGAMLTHGNLISNMLQMDGCFSQLDETGSRFVRNGGEVMISPLPLYHIYAFMACCLCMVHTGNHSVLITNPRDVSSIIDDMRAHSFSAFVGLNTLFVALLEHPDFVDIDFSRLKITNSAGTALVRKTAERWREITGCEIVECYGLTETSPGVAVNLYGGRARLGSVGMPIPGTEVKVVGDDGEELGVGERGELCVRGPQVMLGYWNRPDATAEIIDSDGWLKTGDIAVIDEDGFIHIVDRKKDLIIVSGFNVYPNEIEDVVMSHPQVLNCAVIGVADERSGEAVKLFVVPKNSTLNVQDVKAHCQRNLTGYKIPKHIVLRESLPMSPVGKVLRKDLKALA